MKTKIILAAALAFIVSFASVQGAAAQIVNTYPVSSGTTGCMAGALFSSTTGLPCSSSTSAVGMTSCVTFSGDLYLGMPRNVSDVSRYQTFLINNGYLSAGLSTGYFGSLTLAATKQFQAANSISATGYVGPLTRARISGLTCGGTTPISPAQPITPTNPTNPPTNNAYAPIITSVSPISGLIGSTVTIYGQGFSRTANTVNFPNGIAAATNVPSYDGVSIQFVIPGTPPCAAGMMCSMLAYGPGQYQISVTTSNGTSNTLPFIVTSPNAATMPPVINGITAPTNLAAGQTGTWVINATDVTGGGLSYQATWGDENQQYAGYYYTNSNIFAQTSTLTHTYSSSGTYTPTFVVRGSNGLTAETSATVQVGQQNSGGTTGSTTSSVSLALNQSATINGLQIIPLSIVEDSRCPIGVDCIQAGRVVVQTMITSNIGQTTLDIGTDRSVIVNGVTIGISSVNPYKYQNQIISNDQYVITYQTSV